MSALMRALLYPYMAPEDDGKAASGGSGGGKAVESSEDATKAGDEADQGAAQDQADLAEAGEKTKELTPAELDAGMAEAIGKGLKEKAETPAGEKKTAAPAAGEKPGAPDPKAAAAAKSAVDAEAKAAAEAKTAADAKAAKDKEDAALKGKKVDDLQLTPEMKKALGKEAQQRFHELHVIGKRLEATVEKLTTENKAVIEARDTIMDVLESHKVEGGRDLQPLLEYNLAVKDGRFEDALKIVDTQRAMLLTQLGREADGVDLLKEFPDLSKRVEDMNLNRADALEIAQTRRREAARQQQDQQRGQQQQNAQQQQQVREEALTAIEKWSNAIAKTDIDYKAKEAKIMAKRGDKPSLMDEILKDYPPRLWLPTFQRIYETIESVKAPATVSNESRPLRPNGAKGGAKEPGTMEQAIAQGLQLENADLRQ